MLRFWETHGSFLGKTCSVFGRTGPVFGTKWLRWAVSGLSKRMVNPGVDQGGGNGPGNGQRGHRHSKKGSELHTNQVRNAARKGLKLLHSKAHKGTHLGQNRIEHQFQRFLLCGQGDAVMEDSHCCVLRALPYQVARHFGTGWPDSCNEKENLQQHIVGGFQHLPITELS